MIEGGVVIGNVQGKDTICNPLFRSLVRGFFTTAEGLLRGASANGVLDMGCGEGYVADRLRPALGHAKVIGVDLSLRMLAQARLDYRSNSFSVGTAYQLPFPQGTFDLILALEVLEHLGQPEKALAEVQRVGRGLVLASVPREPIWRALNMARFAYWSSWGNTPGHLNHWSKGGFVRLLKRHFKVLEVRSPFPWTMALCSI